MEKVQSWLVKLSALASFVSGALTAAAGNLPHYESVILSGAGVLVFLAERYWSDIEHLI